MRSLPGTVMLAIIVSVLWHWCRQDDFVLPSTLPDVRRSTVYIGSSRTFCISEYNSAAQTHSANSCVVSAMNSSRQCLIRTSDDDPTQETELMGEPSFNGHLACGARLRSLGLELTAERLGSGICGGPYRNTSGLVDAEVVFSMRLTEFTHWRFPGSPILHSHVQRFMDDLCLRLRLCQRPHVGYRPGSNDCRQASIRPLRIPHVLRCMRARMALDHDISK